MVAERPDLFDCYQSTQNPRAEAALKKARYLASFIRQGPGQALLVGLYAIASSQALTIEQCLARPLHQELMARGMAGMTATEGRTSLLEFKFDPISWHQEWLGRLVISWPKPDRAWYRWLANGRFEVRAINLESLLTQAMPPWTELVLSWAELALLPRDWRSRISQWRGVYLIVDRSDGKQYVGSAYGEENILQRWQHYAVSGHGGNKLLRDRDPTAFQFSILQRTSPDLSDSEVTQLESSWKQRLRTRAPSGLNEN